MSFRGSRESGNIRQCVSCVCAFIIPIVVASGVACSVHSRLFGALFCVFRAMETEMRCRTDMAGVHAVTRGMLTMMLMMLLMNRKSPRNPPCLHPPAPTCFGVFFFSLFCHRCFFSDPNCDGPYDERPYRRPARGEPSSTQLQHPQLGVPAANQAAQERYEVVVCCCG